MCWWPVKFNPQPSLQQCAASLPYGLFFSIQVLDQATNFENFCQHFKTAENAFDQGKVYTFLMIFNLSTQLESYFNVPITHFHKRPLPCPCMGMVTHVFVVMWGPHGYPLVLLTLFLIGVASSSYFLFFPLSPDSMTSWMTSVLSEEPRSASQ